MLVIEINLFNLATPILFICCLLPPIFKKEPLDSSLADELNANSLFLTFDGLDHEF
jgi:hypothetical protein